MADIFREVDEDVRRDRSLALARRFAPLFVGLAVLVVGGIGVWTWMKNREAERLGRLGGEFLGAINAAQTGDGARAGDVARAVASQDASGPYGMLARFFEAARLAEAGDRDGALARLDALATDSAPDQLFRDLALLRGAYLRVDVEEPASFAQRIQPLLAPNQPWRFSALELGALSALRAGDAGRARERLKQIADDAAAPAGNRARATELLSTLGG